MDLYTSTSYKASKLITDSYSTSFGLSIRLFEPALRPHIYAVYGLVRIGDEIVDTYTGADQRELLDNLENETKRAIQSGYSTNPVVHAFAQTAKEFNITSALISPFFKSMRMDLTPQKYDQKKYETYIYGSAEVVGLMCLKLFVNNKEEYAFFEPAAKRLGSAYQKVNFLRDIAADADELNRWYFPNSSKDTFDEKTKRAIVKDIEQDFLAAKSAIDTLPDASQKAVALSYQYYIGLLNKIKLTPARELLRKRVRLSDAQKGLFLVKAAIKRKPRA